MTLQLSYHYVLILLLSTELKIDVTKTLPHDQMDRSSPDSAYDSSKFIYHYTAYMYTIIHSHHTAWG